MKSPRPWFGLTLLTALTMPLGVRAADTPGQDLPSEDRRAQARERLRSNVEALDLTPEQRERLGAVLREERERMAALRDDRELAPRERYRRLREAREEVNRRVKTILTPEQFARWERLRAAEPGQARGGADRKSR